MKASDSTILWYFFIMLYKLVLTSESVDEIRKCNHSSESYWAVLSCNTVYFTHKADLADLGWNLENVIIQMKAPFK